MPITVIIVDKFCYILLVFFAENKALFHVYCQQQAMIVGKFCDIFLGLGKIESTEELT